MSKLRKNVLQKQEKVNLFSDKLTKAKGIFVFEYKGITANDINEFRSKLRSEKIELKVFKNTLFQLAAKKAGIQDLANELTGANCILISYENPLISIQLINELKKKFDFIQIKPSYFENTIINSDVFTELKNIHSNSDMIAKFINTINIPLYKLTILLSELGKKEIKGSK